MSVFLTKQRNPQRLSPYKESALRPFKERAQKVQRVLKILNVQIDRHSSRRRVDFLAISQLAVRLLLHTIYSQLQEDSLKLEYVDSIVKSETISMSTGDIWSLTVKQNELSERAVRAQDRRK